MRIRRIVTAFFTFLGYLTFLSGILAAIFLYIGWRKAEKRANAATATSFKEVPLTPVNTADTDTIAALPHFEPISKSSKKSAPQASAKKSSKWTPKKTKPAKSAAPKPVHAVSVPTVLYTSLDDEPVSAKKTSKWTPKKTAKPKPKKTSIVQADIPGTSIVTWKATDDTSNPRAPKKKFKFYPNQTSALEQEVRRKQQLQEIKDAAELIRNPPVWGSNK